MERRPSSFLVALAALALIAIVSATTTPTTSRDVARCNITDTGVCVVGNTSGTEQHLFYYEEWLMESWTSRSLLQGGGSITKNVFHPMKAAITVPQGHPYNRNCQKIYGCGGRGGY